MKFSLGEFCPVRIERHFMLFALIVNVTIFALRADQFARRDGLFSVTPSVDLQPVVRF
jgi:hypothetical protein